LKILEDRYHHNTYFLVLRITDEILRYAYAIEYDAIYPTQIKPSLETKVLNNLFTAGQIPSLGQEDYVPFLLGYFLAYLLKILEDRYHHNTY